MQDDVDISHMFRCIDCVAGSQSVTFENIFIDDVDNTVTTASSCNTDCQFMREGTILTTLSWAQDVIDTAGGIFGYTMLDLNGAEIFSQEPAATVPPGESIFYGAVDKVQFHSLIGASDGFNAHMTITEDAVDITDAFTCVDCPEGVTFNRLYLDDESTMDNHVGPTHCQLDCEFHRFDICSTCGVNGYTYEYGITYADNVIQTIGGIATLASCIGHCNNEVGCIAVRLDGTDCILKHTVGTISGDGTGVSARRCDLFDQCKTVSIFTMTGDDVAAHFGFTLFAEDGTVLHTEAIQFRVINMANPKMFEHFFQPKILNF